MNVESVTEQVLMQQEDFALVILKDQIVTENVEEQSVLMNAKFVEDQVLLHHSVIVLTTSLIVKEIVMEKQQLMNAVSVEEQEFQEEHVTVMEINSIVKMFAVE